MKKLFLALNLLCFFSPTAFSMEYVEICNRLGECRKFSRLVMGTDHLFQSGWTHAEQRVKDDEAYTALDEAVRNGINFFDTAPIYVGDAENKLGKWRKSRARHIQGNSFYKDPKLNPDRKLYALTKGGFPFDLFWAKRLEKGFHSFELKKELEKRGVLDPKAALLEDGGISLKNVPPGTYASRLYGDQVQIVDRIAEELDHSTKNLHDDIAVYLMHRDDGDAIEFDAITRPKTPVKTILRGLGDSRISDHVWMLGWSNWKTDRVNQSIQLAKQYEDFPKPIINSPYFSLFEMSGRTIHALGVQVTHKEMMDPNFQKGIKIMPYSPLGGFSILDKPEPKWENAKKAAREKFEQGDPYWQNVFPAIFTQENEARLHRVVKFTKAFNHRERTQYTVDQMINAYALAHRRVDLLAVGPLTVEQIRRTVRSLKLSKKLTTQDLEYLYAGRAIEAP